jgi:hypothetical protein
MWEWRYGFAILDGSLDGDEQSASIPVRFTLGDIAPGPYLIEGRLSPRPNALEKRKIYCTSQLMNRGCPARSLVTIATELSPLPRGGHSFVKF